MHYIVGLGNPGEEYKNTRHNLGWWVLDYLRGEWRLPAIHQSARFHGDVTDGVFGISEVTLLYPDTFMNHSGGAVSKLVPSKDIDKLILIYDEVALARGTFKISVGGSAGGHNGVESVIESLGTDAFIRVRVGIAPINQETGEAVRPKADALSHFVLGQISKHEAAEYESVMIQIKEAVEEILTKGVEAAMNKFN